MRAVHQVRHPMPLHPYLGHAQSHKASRVSSGLICRTLVVRWLLIPNSNHRNQYIKELEERLEEMEQELQRARNLNAKTQAQANETSFEPLSPPGGSSQVLPPGDEQLPGLEDSLLEPYLDPSDPALAQLLVAPAHPTWLDLPPKPDARALVEEAFKSFIHYFPIFDEIKFMKCFEYGYESAGFIDLAWWASVNVALSLGHVFRHIRSGPQSRDDDMALSYGYVQNAMGVVPELMGRQDSLAAVQVLLGIILILEGTPNSQMCSVLITTAMGLAHSMGLHRKDRDPPGLSPTGLEERRNAFWIAYWIEKNISFLQRKASMQDDDDIDVELPMGTVSAPHQLTPLGHEAASAPASINIFNSRIGLAIIQGQIYKRLFSVAATTRQTEDLRAASAAELNELLATWRSSVPFAFEEASLTQLRLPLPEDVLQIIILHTVYVNCVITVGRYLPLPPQSDPDTGDFCCYALPTDESIALVESRKVVQLLHKIPRGRHAFIW
jgi:hypothetical protein